MNVILGKNESNSNLQLGDIERRNGLYILGKPRMGKSWLMVSLALQDIENGNGLFFLDPHGDALSDIFARMNWFVTPTQYYLLNPEDTDYTFGINLLQCKKIDNQQARTATFARAKGVSKGVFDKLWKSTFEERPWLQLILQNSLYALIENQGYTLAELPLFFRDRQFRNHIAGNIKYNRAVSDYWLKTFPAKSNRDQDSQMEAAQTRAEIMLGHPYVRDIVGQKETTIDFEALMEKRARIFVKLSASLPHETKKIIGTILISELLHAIERRLPDRRILELYIGLAYGDLSKQRILPFECAKRQGLFKEHVEKVEREIKTEFETQRAIFARRVWQMYEKNIEGLLKKNIMMYNKDREIRGKPECDEYEIEHDRECLKRTCGYAIKAYEGGGHLKRGEIMYGYHDIYYLLEAIAKDFKPLVRRQPNDIPITGTRAIKLPSGIDILPVNIYNFFTRNDLAQRGYEGIVDSIDGSTNLCGLLAKPENHLQVKTRQRGQKAVQTRTIADMVDEMEGELTELPKYTAYAKVLQGNKVWRGKIQAKKLGERLHHTRPYEEINYENLTAVTRKYVCLRREEIEREIRKRQENWKPTAVDEPRVVRDKSEKGPAGPPDEPPPPNRPKPGR
jgi:hypothetical protein